MPPHVRRGGTRGRSNTPRHATQARAGLSAGRSAPRTQGKFAAFDEFCKRLPIEELSRKLLAQILLLPKTGIVRFLRWAIGFAIGIFVLGGALVGYWGPFWPTDPEIHA